MTKFQKLFIALMLFCISVYALVTAVGILQDDSTSMAGRVILLCIVAVIFIINFLILSAEDLHPYHVAYRRQRENKALRRVLKAYAEGLDDCGSFAADVLKRAGGEV